MKFIMDEHIKHRVTGVAVILSIAIIFIPAIVKKSNDHPNDTANFALNSQAKPSVRNSVLNVMKIARVIIPSTSDVKDLLETAGAESVSIKSVVPTITIAHNTALLSTKISKPSLKIASLNTKYTPRKNILIKKDTYAVQLASFTAQGRAQTLVRRLRNQGYIASYSTHNGKNGNFYKVIVGSTQKKIEAKNLQQQLALSLNLNGFVINTGVS